MRKYTEAQRKHYNRQQARREASYRQSPDPWRRAQGMHRAACRRDGYELDRDWYAERLREGVCEASGVELNLAEKRGPWSPETDRIDPTKGYTKDNCRVVCRMYNMAKLCWSDDDVLVMARSLLSKQG